MTVESGRATHLPGRSWPDCLVKQGVLKWEAMSFIKTHPFWALLVAGLVLAVLSFVLFVPGHGSGGMDLGPITPDRSGK
jgi:hypothetical protein